MQLYKIDAFPSTKWASSQAEAKRIAREIKGSVSVVEVPTTKGPLIEFLNVHAS